MAKKLGYIPEKVVYIAKQEKNVWIRFDDLDKKFSENMVHPAFITDPARPKTVETGMQWAKESEWSWDPVKQKSTFVKTKEPTVFEMENRPLHNVRVVDLEKRSQGGRAYKVVVPMNGMNYYADLREDVLTEAIINVGIAKGGTLNGEYVWSRVGSQMKLIRVGSLLHDAMIEATNEDKKVAVGAGDLEVGGIYKSKSKSDMLFLGWFDTVSTKQTNRNYFGTRYTYTHKVEKKVQLWLQLSQYDSYLKDPKSLSEIFIGWSKTKSERYGYGKNPDERYYHYGLAYRLDIIKSRKVIEKTGQVAVEDNWFEEFDKLRDLVWKNEIEPNIKKYRKSEHSYEDPFAYFAFVNYLTPHTGEKFVPKDDEYTRFRG